MAKHVVGVVARIGARPESVDHVEKVLLEAGFAQLDGHLAGPPDVRRYRFVTS